MAEHLNEAEQIPLYYQKRFYDPAFDHERTGHEFTPTIDAEVIETMRDMVNCPERPRTALGTLMASPYPLSFEDLLGELGADPEQLTVVLELLHENGFVTPFEEFGFNKYAIPKHQR